MNYALITYDWLPKSCSTSYLAHIAFPLTITLPQHCPAVARQCPAVATLTRTIHKRITPQAVCTSVRFTVIPVAELVASVALVDRRGAAGVAVPRDQDAVSELWRQRAVDV